MSGEAIVPPTFDSQKTPNRIIAWLTGFLTLLQTIFSFTLSFNALTDLAASHGISIPMLFPLVVEAGVVIFSLNALYRSIHGENTRWQWGLIIGSSLLAGAFNVLHAHPDLVSQFMAAMPSLFLLLSFETLIGQIKHTVLRANYVQSLEQLDTAVHQRRQDIERFQRQVDQLTTEIATLEKQHSTMSAEIVQLQKQQRSIGAFDMGNLDDANAIRQVNKDQALDALIDFYAQSPNASLREAGEHISRSKSSVSNYLDELEAAGRIQRNGQGIEVV